MNHEQATILVDTNVWLDNYIASRSGHETAHRFLASAQNSGMQLLYSASILKDTFYILASNLKEEIRREGKAVKKGDALAIRNIAWACIDNMRELGTAVGVDEADLWLACKYRTLNPDLEDNLVLAAAERAHADYLVTSDEQLIRKSTVTAFTPADMAAYLDARARA